MSSYRSLASLAVLSSSVSLFFFVMIRRPPRSTLDRLSAASDVYKRQVVGRAAGMAAGLHDQWAKVGDCSLVPADGLLIEPVSYTHLRAHETVLDLVCRLLLEKKKTRTRHQSMQISLPPSKSSITTTDYTHGV